MSFVPRTFDRACIFAITCLLRAALAVEEARDRVPRRVRRARSALRRLWRQWLRRAGLARPPVRAKSTRGRRAWNRTPDSVETAVVQLHVEQPQLGEGQLQRLAERVLGFHASKETFRRILARRRDLVVALEDEVRPRPRRIRVSGPRQLWGLDLTTVWVLGVFPMWILGVVDYHGSRLIAFERIFRGDALHVTSVLERLFATVGPPQRILTDRVPTFSTIAFQACLGGYGVRHVRTKPGHPWTNGRIERVFRTFKETVSSLVWLIASRRQLDRFATDFLQWHNRDRPHSAWDGRTPDEVFFGRPKRLRSLGPVEYFDGRLAWYRFG
jgi:putative transposase